MSKQRPRLFVAALIAKPDPLRILLTRHQGSRRWHFPDGEMRFGETIAETVRRSLDEDLRVIPAEIINEHYCIPIETINLAKKTHIVTLHFGVRLSIGLQIKPRKGIEVYWQPIDPHCHSNKFPLLSSTAEVLRRLEEENK